VASVISGVRGLWDGPRGVRELIGIAGCCPSGGAQVSQQADRRSIIKYQPGGSLSSPWPGPRDGSRKWAKAFVDCRPRHHSVLVSRVWGKGGRRASAKEKKMSVSSSPLCGGRKQWQAWYLEYVAPRLRCVFSRILVWSILVGRLNRVRYCSRQKEPSGSRTIGSKAPGLCARRGGLPRGTRLGLGGILETDESLKQSNFPKTLAHVRKDAF